MIQTNPKFRYGSTIKGWVDQNFHEQEEYAHVKNLIEMPEEDAKVSRLANNFSE